LSAELLRGVSTIEKGALTALDNFSSRLQRAENAADGLMKRIQKIPQWKIELTKAQRGQALLKLQVS